MDNFQIGTISEEQLNDFFKDTPDGTPTADTLIAGKDTKIAPKNDFNVDEIDLDNLEQDGDDKPDDKKVDEKVDDKTKDDKKPDTTDDKSSDKDKSKETPEEIKVALKNTVDYLIKSGQWKDFDGRDDLELDETTYAELVVAQDKARLEEMFNELVDSTGDYGKAIIDHIKNGGNPEEVIDIFKEQKQTESIDVNTDEGKLELIGQYYSDIVGWKPEKVKKFLKNLVDEGDESLKSEVDEIKEKYDSYYKEQLADLNKREAEARKEEAKKQEDFKVNIKTVIQSTEDLTDKEKKQLEKSILDFKHKLPNGTMVNDFYVKFAEMQQDPKEYIRLVQFVTDRKGYDAKISTKESSKEAVKAFNFIKGNSSTNRNKGSRHDEIPDAEKASKIDFSGLLKK